MLRSYHGFDDVASHATMILDDARMRAFARALESEVRPGEVVADIGAGLGILSLLAVRAGARRVFAVERSSIGEIAAQVVQENGAEETVDILRTDARDVRFAEPPSLVVCEMLGHFGIDEDIVGILRVVKERCAEDVRMIPRGFEIVVAPLSDESLARELRSLQDVEGVRLASLRERLVNRVFAHRVQRSELAGPGVGTGMVRLPEDPLPELYRAELTVEQPSDVNALGAWFRAELAQGVDLSTGPDDPATHWFHYKFPLDPPLRCARGDLIEVEIEPRIGGGRGVWRWRARQGGEERGGDMFDSVGGGPADLARQLGVRILPKGERTESPRLEAWTAALGGRIEGDVRAMSEKLLAALPERYADLSDAREEVLRLLKAAGALG